MLLLCSLKDTHRENAPSNKNQTLTESMHIDIWIVGTLNELFIRDSYTEVNFSQQLVAKLRSLR